MGSIGGLLGFNGGANGTGFELPQMAAMNSGIDPDKLQAGYAGTQNSLQSQQALLQALKAQNGLGNQSQVYNQLQGVANGTGPNPAQAMLNQATGQNVANQSAMMAGQRGAGANVGLMARQAAQQGAGIQQNAAGQAATLQANQSLNALGAAGNMANQQVSNQMAGTSTNMQANLAQQQLLQNANSQYNNSIAAMQGNINNSNSQMAGTNMQGQQGLLGGIMSGFGATSSAGGMGMMAAAEGGMVGEKQIGNNPPKMMADGGPIQIADPSMPQSSFGQFLAGWSPGPDAVGSVSIPGPAPLPDNEGAKALAGGSKSLEKWGSQIGSGTQGPSQDMQMPSVGSQFTPQQPSLGVASSMPGAPAAASYGTPSPDMAEPSLGVDTTFARGGNVGGKLKSGGGVPGKASMPGNSYQNDTVKALLSPGEVVIPRNVMQSANPVDGAARFVAAVLAKKKAGGRR